MIRYGSLFSGIEAASLAFEPLGWQPQWFAEIEPFCCQVLQKHWPNIPNLGDVNNPEFAQIATPVDLIIGGSPCPSFSLAGKRGGMEDPRGLLTLRFCQLLQQIQPRWFIWENVPGVLSSNNGQDFEVILNEMVKSGYAVCWRVLDAQCFGLPQSRKRLYVVGRLGNQCPLALLDDLQSSKNSAHQYGEEWKKHSFGGSELALIPLCLRGRECGIVMEFMKSFGCLRSSTFKGCINHVWDGQAIRLLTPLEFERLQGMPDNHTQLEVSTPAKFRWKAVGNSMALPVIRWIGEAVIRDEMRLAAASENPST